MFYHSLPQPSFKTSFSEVYTEVQVCLCEASDFVSSAISGRYWQIFIADYQISW